MDLFFLLAKPFLSNLSKAILVLLFLCLFTPILNTIFLNRIRNDWRRAYSKIFIILIIILGLYSRLVLAYFREGNVDIRSWKILSDFAAEGKNIYVASDLYNYFPPWIVILGWLGKINKLISFLPFHFIVKLFLIIVDCLILYILFLICRLNRFSFNRIASLFFLNPVSIIITGYHGQFEGLAVFFILLSIYIYQKKRAFWPAFLIVILGGITKHMFYNQVVIFLRKHFQNKLGKIILFFFLSLVFAFSTLLPYWRESSRYIIRNVFFYSLTFEKYGFPRIIKSLGLINLSDYYKYLFALIFMFLPMFFPSKNILHNSLLGTLLFVVFGSAMCDQYMVIPIAIGALSSSVGFYFYTFFASIYFLGSPSEFAIPGWRFFSDNTIWLIALLWFIFEIFKSRFKKYEF